MANNHGNEKRFIPDAKPAGPATPEELARAQAAFAAEVVMTNPVEVKAELQTERRQLFEAMRLIFSGDDTLEQGVNLLEQTQITIKDSHFRVTDFVGQGSFGFVVTAELVGQPEIKVALKLSAPFDRRTQKLRVFDTREKAEFVRGFIREVAALKKINELQQPSPYPEYFDAQFVPDPDDDNQRILALVMEEIEGENLEELIPEKGFAETPDILFDIAQQCTEGIQLTHQAGFVHRDIKPGNVLLDNDGRVRLLDLGLVAFQIPTDSERTVWQQSVPDAPVGTDEYKLDNESDSIDPARDIYALGVTFQELLVGRVFKNYMESHKRMNAMRDPTLKRFIALANNMIRTDAVDRPTIDQVVNEIREIHTEYQLSQVREKITASA